MIQVQIASQVTAGGMDGIRWVLVDLPDGPAAVPTEPAALPAAAPVPVASTVAEVQARPAVSLALLKLAVLGLSAGLALWFAQASYGPVTAPAWSSAERAQPMQRTTTPPPPAAQPMPAAPSPSASASMAASLLAAELK